MSALQGFGYGMIGGLIFGVGLVILIAGGASAPALLKAMGCLSATGAVQSAFMYFQNMQQGNTCSAMYNCITFALSAVGAVKCFEYAGQVNAANAAKTAAEKAKSGKTVAAKEVSGSSKGTVWDDINPTQPKIPGTEIPKSFEITAKGEKFWVHPNATKHMVEYVGRNDMSHGMQINSQTILTSFQNAVETATAQGITYDQMMTIGNWELIFSQPREAGLLPVIKYAQYIP